MKLFSVDAEVNGLYGPVFAIGVTVRQDGCEVAQFQGRLPNTMVTHAWGIERALPAIAQLPVTHQTLEALEEDFWAFWLQQKNDAVVIVHCGSPVESGLFRRCVERQHAERTFQGPYPAINDVATLLLLLNEPADSVDQYAEKFTLTIPVGGRPHNPYYDAVVTALVWEHAWRRLQPSRGGPDSGVHAT